MVWDLGSLTVCKYIINRWTEVNIRKKWLKGKSSPQVLPGNVGFRRHVFDNDDALILASNVGCRL